MAGFCKLLGAYSSRILDNRIRDERFDLVTEGGDAITNLGVLELGVSFFRQFLSRQTERECFLQTNGAFSDFRRRVRNKSIVQRLPVQEEPCQPVVENQNFLKILFNLGRDL